MSRIAAHIRNGRIELDEPLPADWPDGTSITVGKADADDDDLDITGDSPEAIAAWLAWHTEFQALPRNEDLGLEMEQILNERRKEGKAQVAARWKLEEEQSQGAVATF